jgi:hypothetical protein
VDFFFDITKVISHMHCGRIKKTKIKLLIKSIYDRPIYLCSSAPCLLTGLICNPEKYPIRRIRSTK